ncbi:MAG: SDR family NAD(P)-dependent oxidoreductase [Spirochaetes bacterium]|nr:SDR family NAD(P)-dependent oxidoreductase [Spirochaetota bacterium]
MGTGLSWKDRYGPWALVAGASAGIGEAWAREAARRGLNVVLLARRAAPLRRLSGELAERYGVKTIVLPLDLSRADSVEVLARRVRGLEIGLVICNAAAIPVDPFLERGMEEHLAAMNVNVRAPLALAHRLGAPMLARGRGGMVFMASLSASMGTARVVHYAATKAWNRVFAEGLWVEWRKHGVDALACVAGTVDTPGMRASNARSMLGAQSAEAVVRASVAALGKRPSVIPGWGNRISGFFMERLMPRKLMIQLLGGVMERMYPRPDVKGPLSGNRRK